MIKCFWILICIVLNLSYSSTLLDSIDKYTEGLKFYKKKNYGKSTTLFKEALNINSNITYPYIMLGNSLYYQKKYSDAIKEYKNYLNNPYDKDNIGYVYLYIAKCYRKLTNFNLSLTNLKKSQKYEFYDETDYYFEALNYFNDKESITSKNRNIIIKDKNFFDSIYKSSKKYTNSYYIQNNLGRFHIYRAEAITSTNQLSTDIITNLDIATPFFKRAITLNKTNKFKHFQNYYYCFAKKGEFYKRKYENTIGEEKNNYQKYYDLAISNYEKAIDLINNSTYKVFNYKAKKDLRTYNKNKKTLKKHYKKYFKKDE